MARKFTQQTKQRFRALRDTYIEVRRKDRTTIDGIWRAASLKLDFALSDETQMKIISEVEAKLAPYTKNVREN